MPLAGIELCYLSREDWEAFTVRKLLSGLSTRFHIRRMGASLLDLPHFLIIPMLHYFPIHLPGIAPKAYL